MGFLFLFRLQSRTLAIAKATLYLLTSLGMVPSGKAALVAASASSAILSTVAAYNKEQDFVFKAYAKECLQVGRGTFFPPSRWSS